MAQSGRSIVLAAGSERGAMEGQDPGEPQGTEGHHQGDLRPAQAYRTILQSSEELAPPRAKTCDDLVAMTSSVLIDPEAPHQVVLPCEACALCRLRSHLCDWDIIISNSIICPCPDLGYREDRHRAYPAEPAGCGFTGLADRMGRRDGQAAGALDGQVPEDVGGSRWA